jgi:hypothetical protein
MQTYSYEYTDIFAGQANYCWVKRGTVNVPELIHYGYTGSTDGSYSKANKAQMREVMRLVKDQLGLTGVRGTRESCAYAEVFRPYRSDTILFVEFKES